MSETSAEQLARELRETAERRIAELSAGETEREKTQ